MEDDLAEHPAVRAWRELGLLPLEPLYIEVLKNRKKKGSVYRLAGVGREDSAVIAKWCRPERAVVERAVYEKILPQLSVRTPHYYGSVEGDAGFWWIFLEDVGNRRYSPLSAEHCALAAEWLGAMHTSAECISHIGTLPARDPEHYHAYLRSALEMIPRIQSASAVSARGRRILQDIRLLCYRLNAKWSHIESWCEPVPRTFIHGDCLVKNAHVRDTANGPAFAPFDWGGAGWGLPATDLGQLGLPYRRVPPSDPDYHTYAQVVGEQWPHLGVDTIRQLGHLGQIFWSLKVISRCLPEFDDERTHLESLTEDFAIYGDVLAKAIRATPWHA